MFLSVNYTLEQFLTLYIDSKRELPYIYLMSKTKVANFPRSVQRNIIYSSYNNVHLLVGKYFSIERKETENFACANT